MGGPPEPREARSEGKLHDPPIQGSKHSACDPGWRAYAVAMRRRPAMV